MTTEDKASPADEGRRSSEGLGLTASAPKPRAWAIFTDSGNARMWTTFQPHVQKLADAEGLTVTPLYDQAALDAAVAAERERCAKLREALQASQSWLYGHENTWGQVERRRLNDEALKA